ncbi:M10 family metallopeptidase C-terminal domain-containing protein [Azorhizophilus paspali]|uniref:M10 family metallopeptidase C-terminal domain-containing protein n=1 Tax=Azorhizophilus paspali TaxID=69963 RepID=A0ABV6SRR4_AZOPA
MIYLKNFGADAEGWHFEISLKGDLADLLDGGNPLFAAETLEGSAANDTLIGGAGADLFCFSCRADSYRIDSEIASDRIADFDADEDRIDLSTLGFSSLGDNHDGTLAVQASGDRSYLKSFEADAEGRRFGLALEGDYDDGLSADAFLIRGGGRSAPSHRHLVRRAGRLRKRRGVVDGE